MSEVVKQINELANVSKGFGESKLPLAKLLAEELQPWQKNALEKGLNLEVLCSTWLNEEIATRLLGQHTAEQLDSLSEYQIKGLANGFTRDQVTVPGFTRMHVEARRATPEFRKILEDALARRFSPEEWRTLLATPIGGKNSLLYKAINGDHFDLMLAMLEVGQYTQEQLRALVPRPAAVNAVMTGNLAMISTMRDICGAEQWKRYMDDPLPSNAGNIEGLNCLWLAIYRRKVSVVKMLREEFSPDEWIVRITTPISRDYADLRLKAGFTPLYNAALSGPTVAALLEGYTKQRWRQLINMPLTQAQGPDKGATPVSIADFYSADEAIKTMREGGDYSVEEWNRLPKGRKWEIPFLIEFGWPGLSKNAIAEGSSAVSESVENTAALASSHITSSGKR